MTPGHVPWPSASAEQKIWSSLSQFHGLYLCVSPVVSTAIDKWNADTPIHLDPSTTPDQRSLSSLECCVRAVQHGDPVFLASKSCVTGFPHQLEWEMSHTVADRTSTIVASRGLDTTSSCGHSERPAQKSRSKPCSRAVSFSSWLPIYSCCSLVTMALRFGHKSSSSSSSREVSKVLGFTVSNASKQ